MRSKLKFVVPAVLLLLVFGFYKVALESSEAKPKPKLHGQVYVLPKEFVLNLGDERYVKLSVALVLPEGEPTAAEGDHAAAKPPEGFGTLPQEAAVRDVITDEITGGSAQELIDRSGRDRVKRRIVKVIRQKTDVHVKDVLFTDLAVQ